MSNGDIVLVGIHRMVAGSNQICARFGFQASRDRPPNRHRLAGGPRRAPLRPRRTFGRPNFLDQDALLLWVLTNA